MALKVKISRDDDGYRPVITDDENDGETLLTENTFATHAEAGAAGVTACQALLYSAQQAREAPETVEIEITDPDTGDEMTLALTQAEWDQLRTKRV